MENRKYPALVPASALLLAALAAADLFTGEIRISPADVLAGLSSGQGTPASEIFFGIRLPRMLTALISGAALSLSGVQMQSIFRNPLADPHIMGVSSGAGLGAAIATMAVPASLSPMFSGITTAAAAFAGALAAAALIMSASSRLKTPSSLLVFGVMTGFILSATVSVIQYGAGAESLRIFYSWSAGNFTGNTAGDIGIMAAALAIGTLIAVCNAKGLDILLFGDEFAALSGARPQRIRTWTLLGSSLMTGTVTAFCGPLGFVGIVAPHLARRICGTAIHRAVIPMCMVTGGIFGVAADIISQGLGIAVPAGSMMALIGIPFVLLIMLGGRKSK